MRRRLLALAPLGALLFGCSAQMDDLVAYTNQVKQTTRVSIEPYPEFKSSPAFQYSAQSLRSPFARPKGAAVAVAQVTQKNCLQPDSTRTREALEQYGIDALSLGGQFTVQGTQWVLFKTTDGGLYKATIGSRLGLFFGRITNIDASGVTIEELLPDGAGCWQRKETTLTLNGSAGENENV